VSKSLNILQDISLAFKPKEFIVVVGQSGGGKSTLVDAIAGYRPATHGRIIVNKTIDVYKEFDAIRSTIGYVPQKDIIHMELTVFQALNYAAQLRMPADTTETERNKRIDEVMDDLDLAHRRDTQISQLSGGQQKRVSIGVELLTKPTLFFLDEPTSGLDPGMETELMRLMRKLADQGRTIVMITHATKNVMLADKVVFLARGGFLSWFGPPEEALAYFDKYRTERDRRASSMEFDHIYTLLDQEELGTAPEWKERFKKDPAYQKYIQEPLSGEAQKTDRQKIASKSLSKGNQVSFLRQLAILSARNVRILTRDLFSLFLLLVTAPIMASLDFMVASGIGRDPFGFVDGNFSW
jgi:ABC transport system ATP-binding/permease protein